MTEKKEGFSPWLLVIFSSLVLIVFSLSSPISVGFDQATQLYAVQQWHEGLVPFPLFSLLPNPADLSHSSLYWEIWWAPGFPLLIAWLGSWGFSLGAACKCLACFFYLLGNFGWVRWISLFPLSRSLLKVIAFTLPWNFFASHELLTVSGEILSYGTVPWLLIGTYFIYKNWIDSAREPAWRAFFWDWCYGTGLALVYLLKHDAFLIGPGLLAFLLITVMKNRRLILWFRLGSIFISTALPLLFWNWLNRHLNTHANLVAATWRPHLNWREAFHLLANIPQDFAGGAALADALWRYGTNASISWYGLVNLYGMGGWILILPLVFYFGYQKAVEKMACLGFFSTAVFYYLTVCLSYDVDLTPRHLLCATQALLPLIFCAMEKAWQAGRFWNRLNVSILSVLYLVIPLTFSLGIFIHDALSTQNYQTSENRLYVPSIKDHDLPAFLHRLKTLPTAGITPLWLSPDPLLTLELPERKINGAVPLRSRGGNTTQPFSLCVILERQVGQEENSNEFLNQFPQATPWKKTDLPQTDYEAWTTILKVKN